MAGRTCRLEPLDASRHTDGLYAMYQLDPKGRNWTYLPESPFQSPDECRQWTQQASQRQDILYFVVIEFISGDIVGSAAYMRILEAHGSIEVGSVYFSDRLKKTRAASEAMYLMMKNVFELGYRRYEWKCDALNAASRAAAARFGFTYEGTFRNARVDKERSRDTAWFSITSDEWPAVSQAFQKWLAPENFDVHGCQRVRLSVLTRPAVAEN